MITELQSAIIAGQQEWQGAGRRQGSAGAATHWIAIANMNIAPYLPKDIMDAFRSYFQTAEIRHT